MRLRSMNWGLIGLAAAVLAVAVPFAAFVLLTSIAPDGPTRSAQYRAPTERAIAARTATRSGRTTLPAERTRRAGS